MRRATPLLLAALLAGCAGRMTGPARTDAPGDDAARSAPETAEPAGRMAGTQILQFGYQRTYWVMHCPRDTLSPLRGACALTRSDIGPKP